MSKHEATKNRPLPGMDTDPVRGDCDSGGHDEDGGTFILKKLLSSRTVLLAGAVDTSMAKRVINQLLLLEANDPKAPVTLLMNSPGGSVTDGFAIHDMIRFVRPRVRIVCAGLAASIATVILAAADVADRLALPHTRLMIHQPLIPANIYGPASDLEITANEIIKTRERVNRILAEATGQPYEVIDRDTQRDYWLTATEAVDYGLVTRVVTERADLDE